MLGLYFIIKKYKISVDELDLTLDWRCVLYMVLSWVHEPLFTMKIICPLLYFAKYSAFLQKSLFLLIATPSIHTIQALILFTIYLYSINERNIAWLITGIACRLSIAMGLHRESTTKLMIAMRSKFASWSGGHSTLLSFIFLQTWAGPVPCEMKKSTSLFQIRSRTRPLLSS